MYLILVKIQIYTRICIPCSMNVYRSGVEPYSGSNFTKKIRFSLMYKENVINQWIILSISCLFFNQTSYQKNFIHDKSSFFVSSSEQRPEFSRKDMKKTDNWKSVVSEHSLVLSKTVFQYLKNFSHFRIRFRTVCSQNKSCDCSCIL